MKISRVFWCQMCLQEGEASAFEDTIPPGWVLGRRNCLCHVCSRAIFCGNCALKLCDFPCESQVSSCVNSDAKGSDICG